MVAPKKESGGLSVVGLRRSKEITLEFNSYLISQAQLHARRRGAKEIDNADLDAAYRDLIMPRERPFWVDVSADSCLFFSGIMMGYGLPLALAGSTNSTLGWIVTGAFAVIAGFCAILKHTRF